jgi:hypothetical protein
MDIYQLSALGHCQYLNYHGQQGARLSRDQSVHGNTYEQRSIMMKCLAPLLFNAPYEHVRSLHRLYVDSIVNHLDWRTFVQKLNAEMQDFNLLVSSFHVRSMQIRLTLQWSGDSALECECRILGDSERR